MKGFEGVVPPWAKWVGGAALIIAVVAVLVLKDWGGTVGPRAEIASQIAVKKRATLGDSADQSRGSVPRFRPAVRPGERHFQALLMKDRARAEGGQVPRSSDLFDGEERDPIWAPAMEGALKERLKLARELFANAGLKDIKLLEPACRTSTCRLELEYTDRELAKAREAGGLPADQEPYGFFVRQTGPFSRSSSDLRPEPLEVVDGVIRLRQTTYLVFGENESNPDNYAQWVSDTHRQHAEYRQKRGPSVTIKGLPPPELR
jgi:hypothetical protein